MPKFNYIPDSDEGKAALFERFRNTIGSFSALLGLSAPEVAAQAADANWFRYTLNHSISMRDSASQWVGYKNLLLSGTGDAAVPVTPPLPTPEPPEVDLGILARFRELARRVKAAPAYNESIGEALGIIGTDQVLPDPSTVTPEISLRTIGGKVEVVWNKGMMEAVEIQKDTGTGWQFLAVDTRPDYTDTNPFPTPAAKWKYRAIYTTDSQRTGQWSNVAEISVGG